MWLWMSVWSPSEIAVVSSNTCQVNQGNTELKSGWHVMPKPATPWTCRCTLANLLMDRQKRISPPNNFFKSYVLGEELLIRKLTIGNSLSFSSNFAFTETCPGAKKTFQKNVSLMSILHRDAAVSHRKDKKPQMILDYNQNKGGVDNLDKVMPFFFMQYIL